MVDPSDSGLALQFERSDSMERLRLVLCELLYIGSQVNTRDGCANNFVTWFKKFIFADSGISEKCQRILHQEFGIIRQRCLYTRSMRRYQCRFS